MLTLVGHFLQLEGNIGTWEVSHDCTAFTTGFSTSDILEIKFGGQHYNNSFHFF